MLGEVKKLEKGVEKYKKNDFRNYRNVWFIYWDVDILKWIHLNL